jgi:ribosome-associated protein
LTVSDQEPKSRSRIRREYLELKELGKQLSQLSEGPLRKLPLSEKTLTALLDSKTMKRTALQRQYKYITTLLTEYDDADAVREGIVRALRPRGADLAKLHAIELWRDRLVAEEEGALTEFVAQHPNCDQKRLTRLVRDAVGERELDRAPKSARMLFRYLRDLSNPTA